MSATRSDDEPELDLEEAMDLWRDDTRRRAARIEPSVLTDRILRENGSTDAALASEDRATFRYAAAAVLLIGLGLGGSLWVGARPQPAAAGVSATLRALEDGRLALEGDRASQDFDAATRAAGEER